MTGNVWIGIAAVAIIGSGIALWVTLGRVDRLTDEIGRANDTADAVEDAIGSVSRFFGFSSSEDTV